METQNGGLRNGLEVVDHPGLHQLISDQDIGVFRKRQTLTEADQECLILSPRLQLIPGAVRNDDQRVAGHVGQDLNLLAGQVAA